MPVPIDLAAMTEEAALDFIESLASENDQAACLVENSHLTNSRRGAALMKRIASDATPERSQLLVAQKRRDAEKAAKKARAAERRAAKQQPTKFTAPSLFTSFR